MSWLAKAKSIHDLGNWFCLAQPGDDRYREREDAADAKWVAKLKESLPVEPEFGPFFGSRMHDSWVIGIERISDVLRVRLNSSDAVIFAYGVAAVTGEPPSQTQWPVDLLLHDPKFVRAARHDPEGRLRFADWRDLHSESLPTGDTFLNDWFYQQDGRLQWIADVHAWRPALGTLTSSLYLMVDCTKATAVDHRTRAIREALGPGAATLWEDAYHRVDCSDDVRHIFGRPPIEDYIRRRMAARGITIADLVQPKPTTNTPSNP